MRFLFPAITLGLLLALPVSGGDDGLTGNWKLSIIDGNEQIPFWIVGMQSKDGKLNVTTTPLRGPQKVEVKDVKLVGDTFAIQFQTTITQMGQKVVVHFDYEGKLPKPGAKKILGSLSQDGSTVTAVLEATTAKNGFELDREFFLKSPTDPKSFAVIFDLLDVAEANKVDVKDVESWINTSLKASEAFGPRYQNMHQMRLLDIASNLKAYPAVAKTFAASLDKLEGAAYGEYAKSALNFKVDKAAPRKVKGNRPVLVELFTGAQCPPCVAADMAFDGLEKTYSPTDVVLLQYHVHIPRPDPLANFDSDARYEYYLDVKKARGTPSSLFNGKPMASGGGFKDDAAEKYKEYCDTVNKMLDAPDTAKLSGGALRVGDNLKFSVKVQDLSTPGDKVRLRLALVEDWVRYKGSNGLQYHHRVVRSMPGGAKGFTLKAKDFDHTAEVDLDKLRKTLNKYLDEDYPEGSRPMRLRNLHVVAFVQNDDTTEVLHAIDMPVRDQK